MKKRIFAILLCLFMTFCQVNVYAASPYDSVILDSDEEDSVKKHEYERVIKAYENFFWLEFAKEKDIYKIVEDSNSNGYFVYSFSNPIRAFGMTPKRYLRDGEIIDHTDSSNTDLKGEFFKYAIYPEYVLGPNVCVIETYCLDGQMTGEGCFIYYVTDNGDFVLHKHGVANDDLYLFPAQEIYTIAKSLVDLWHKESENVGLSYPTEVLSEYKITPDIFYLFVSPILLICFIPVFIRNKRRKNAALNHS